MELIRYSYNLKSRHRGCVATIGNYDGIHLGHQAVLRQLRRHAEVMGLPAMVITFEPHPQEFFSAVKTPTRITSFREKLEMLKQQNIDRVLCLRFQQSIADLSAEQFIEQVLVGDLSIKRLIIGDDFKFGKNRRGDFRMLREFGKRLGFDVILTETHRLDGDRVSSSIIRERLQESRFEEAQLLLGRYFSISGRVVHGAKRGRQLGFPTANINLSKRAVPLRGVFAVSVKGADETTHLGVANLGTRPVFEEKKLLLEAHLFDFDKMIYGRHISVEFFKRLRDERKFSSIDELVVQIAADIRTAREFFNGLNPESQG
ncbi:MAG: bifunctional riboflavin kinase/FAD synthetase [Gammaproteobacteria bacterium]|nr:bifunctional riboflavin kinase/FAD synthetase [Gammaproteobacteria bacterium]